MGCLHDNSPDVLDTVDKTPHAQAPVESDQNIDREQPADSRPKKRARVRPSRSARALEDIRVKILELAYDHVRARIACCDAYPDNDMIDIIGIDSFACAFHELKRHHLDLIGVSEEPEAIELARVSDLYVAHFNFAPLLT